MGADVGANLAVVFVGAAIADARQIGDVVKHRLNPHGGARGAPVRQAPSAVGADRVTNLRKRTAMPKSSGDGGVDRGPAKDRRDDQCATLSKRPREPAHNSERL